ncbi:MAG: adenylate cyclase [Pseudomonadota bacterium]|nr:adenylate cyclase [Pseudomonadota bacterium]
MTLSNKQLKIYHWLVSFILTLLLVAHTAGQLTMPTLQRIENILYDLRLRTTMPNTLDERIVILDIDEKSLAQEGHWPWRRDKLADLVDILFDYYGIKLIGFDVVFSEKNENDSLQTLEKLAENQLKNDPNFLSVIEKIRPSLLYDDRFSQSLQHRPVVLGYFFSHHNEKNNEIGQLPLPFSDTHNDFTHLLFEAKSYIANLPTLQTAALTGGYLNNANVDEDGVYRRLPIITNYNHQLYSTLALSLFSQLLNLPPIEFVTSNDYGENRLEAVKLAGFTIPVDDSGNLLVPFRGNQGSFNYISVTDVLNGAVDVAKLKDKIVIIGTSAAGLLDLRSTPVQNIYAGVEVHANILSGLLDQSIKSRPTYIIAVEMLELVLLFILSMVLFSRVSIAASALIFASFCGLMIALNVYLWSVKNVDTHLATPLILFSLLYGGQMFFGFFFENRKKKQLGMIFGQYIPKELVEEMSNSDEEFTLKGENREMTVFFSDVRGFTTISESLQAAELCDLINAILTPVTRIIHENNGTIDKYIGDAIMAFWGAPMHTNKHAYLAVKAGLTVIKEFDSINAHFKLKNWPEVDLGVGLNTGEMVVGNMGSEFRIAYTVMGDTVNLGSRLEGLTKQYGVKMIVSESTRAAAPEFVYRELDWVRVKGKNKPIKIYEPICEQADIEELEQKILNYTSHAIDAYRQQKWDEAHALFSDLHDAKPHDLLYRIYLERIAYFTENPPTSNWDGTFTHTSK